MFWPTGFWPVGFWPSGFWGAEIPVGSDKIFVSKKVTFPFMKDGDDIIFLRRKVTFPVTIE